MKFSLLQTLRAIKHSLMNRQRQQLQQQYKSKVKLQVQLLNELDHNISNYRQQLAKIIAQISKLDETFVYDKGYKILGHFLFTRHGKCQNWADKKFGMNPNSCVSEEAVLALKQTSKNTNLLLNYAGSTIFIGVSPIVRAKQTACLMKPQACKFVAKILPELAENSEWPSGCDIDSLQTIDKQIGSLSYFKNPLRKIVYSATKILFSDEQKFNKIKQKSQQSDKILLIKPELKEQQSFKNSQNKSSENTQNFLNSKLTKQQKSQKIMKLIQNTQHQQRDIWLFGHSGNFTYFFTRLFGITDKFAYCQTRKVYKIGKQINLFFHPPYDYYIDQNFGTIKAFYNEDRLKIRST